VKNWLAHSIASGADAVMLRLHGQNMTFIQSLLQVLGDTYAERSFGLILNHADVAAALAARNLSSNFPLNLLDGLHLPARSPLPNRELLGTQWLGRSCHNLAEVVDAEDAGFDYVTLSPIFPTKSHPDAVPIWPEGLEQIVKQVQIPIVALGGITAANRMFCLDAGAIGTAAIGMFEAIEA
jgi:thiamine monophosphate synthase